MSNKDKFKELYSNKMNKEKNYNRILEKIERNEKNKNKYLKYSFAPICLAVVICGIMALGNNNNFLLAPENNKPYGDKSNSIININNINGDIKTNKIDATIKEVSNYYNIPYYEVLSNLSIPSDLENKEYTNAIYVKSDSTKENYDKLMEYEKNYQNINRSITIRYSKDYKPLRDYHFEEDKTSTINNFELTIYKYENSYMTTFNYKNLNIDIETTNITEEELVSLLQSIIK